MMLGNAGEESLPRHAPKFQGRKIFPNRWQNSPFRSALNKKRVPDDYGARGGGVEQMDDWPDFKGVDWSDQYPRLLLYAEGRLRRLQWPRGRPQSQDFVQRAIEKALSGERKFDSGKTLLHNLCQIISSDIGHEVKSYNNRHVTSEDDAVVNMVDYRQQNPEEAAHYRQLARHFLDYLDSHDSAARIVADLMINSGITKSNEIAVHRGLSISEIENIKKRLRRLTENYRTARASA
jgi:DNA-directed RNA polymerase specialized sigma24 family protein